MQTLISVLCSDIGLFQSFLYAGIYDELDLDGKIDANIGKLAHRPRADGSDGNRSSGSGSPAEDAAAQRAAAATELRAKLNKKAAKKAGIKAALPNLNAGIVVAARRKPAVAAAAATGTDASAAATMSAATAVQAAAGDFEKQRTETAKHGKQPAQQSPVPCTQPTEPQSVAQAGDAQTQAGTAAAANSHQHDKTTLASVTLPCGTSAPVSASAVGPAIARPAEKRPSPEAPRGPVPVKIPALQRVPVQSKPAHTAPNAEQAPQAASPLAHTQNTNKRGIPFLQRFFSGATGQSRTRAAAAAASTPVSRTAAPAQPKPISIYDGPPGLKLAPASGPPGLAPRGPPAPRITVSSPSAGASDAAASLSHGTLPSDTDMLQSYAQDKHEQHHARASVHTGDNTGSTTPAGPEMKATNADHLMRKLQAEADEQAGAQAYVVNLG